jgi:hypothetical protein
VRLELITWAPVEPVRRYERENPGELIHIDIKKFGWSGYGRRTGGSGPLLVVGYESGNQQRYAG